VEYQPDVKNITGAGGIVASVLPDSIAEDLGIRPGDTVVAVGDLQLRDVIDYRYAISDELIEMHVRNAEGDVIFEIEKDPDEDLGIEFTEPLFDRLRTCNNKCPFCFLTQMPKGMRKTLYLKDDDYRLSFLYNNFVTMTNLSEEDWQRIEQQHLSPLHMSVHATDRAMRAIMLGKSEVPDVHDQIRRLARAGITVHTQIVACPGVNDGAVLRQSIEELAAHYPTVQSIAVVPVGLTKFRFDGKRPSSIRAAIQVHETPEWINSNWERQPLWQDQARPASGQESGQDMGFCSRLGVNTADVPLRCYTGAEAATVIDLVEPYSRQFYAQLERNLVYASDEFYLLAERTLPHAAYYDGFPQYSNGVGMVRDFLDSWARARRRLPRKLTEPLRVGLVCGTLIAPTMQVVVERLNRIEGLELRLLPQVNHFFGEMVTVSGLLMGQDIVPTLRDSGCDVAVLPRVMFDHQGQRTLDEYSPQRIAEEAGLPIAMANDPEELIEVIGDGLWVTEDGIMAEVVMGDG
jgi:NifB/MoaA-like Fe-S oxidoreductase